MISPSFVSLMNRKRPFKWAPGTVSLTCDGNGLTATDSVIPSYPLLLKYIPPVSDASIRQVNNIAHNGYTAADMLANNMATVTDAFNSACKYNVLIVWELANSIQKGSSPSEAVDQVMAYVQAAKQARPWKVVVVTAIPLWRPKINQISTQQNIDAYNNDVVSANNLLMQRYSLFADICVDLRATNSPFNFASYEENAFISSRLYTDISSKCSTYGNRVIARIIARSLSNIPD